MNALIKSLMDIIIYLGLSVIIIFLVGWIVEMSFDLLDMMQRRTDLLNMMNDDNPLSDMKDIEL